MPPKKDLQTGASTGLLTIDDLVRALQDEAVVAALGAILDKRIAVMEDTINELRTDNNNVRRELVAANQRIESLEAYSMRPDVIISGLPMANFAEAVVSSQPGNLNSSEHAAATEAAVLNLFNKEMNIAVAPQDISVAHRLPKRRKADPSPAQVIVRFTNIKTRDAVYRARLALKGRPGLYINEHLTRKTASLFKDARTLVKEKRLSSTWTTNGVLYIKKSNDPVSKPVKVLSASELQNAVS